MVGVTDLIANEGHIPGTTQTKGITPKRRGVYQGVFIFLLSFLVVPIVTMITIALKAEPFAVVAAAVLFTVGGLLRIAYALMFESNVPGSATMEGQVMEAVKSLSGRDPAVRELPPEQSIPVNAYTAPSTGGWKDTSDLAKAPGSVTDSTTKLLQKDTNQ
jgi:hypothetical protein